MALAGLATTAVHAQEVSAPVRGGTLVIAQDSNPPTLDPQKSAAFATTNVTELMYTCLLRWNADGTAVEPDLAESYEVIDPKTYSFTLREGVKFHNGEVLTSADVRFTFERIANPDTGSPWKSIFSSIESIEMPDDRKVIFHLSEPFAPFLNYLATVKYSGIVNKKDVTERGDLASGGAGTGPFKLDSFKSNASVLLSRHEDYYEKGLPYLDAIELRIITDEGSRAAALRSGSAAMSWVITPEVADQLTQRSGFVTPEKPAMIRALLIELDQSKPPFNDVRVRRAFSMAVNRQQIVNVVWRGRAALTASIPPAQTPYGVASQDVAALPYNTEDLAAARALMAEAGYADGLDTTFSVSPLTLSDVTVAQVVQQQAARIGIRIKIEQKEWGALLRDFQGTLAPISMAGLAPAPDPEANLRVRFLSASSVNPGKTKDPELDTLFARGRAANSEEERIAIYRRMQERIADQAYAIFPAASPMFLEVWSEKLKGYKSTPFGQRVLLRESWLTR